MMAEMPGLQRRLRIDGSTTITIRMMTPAQQQHRFLCIDDGNNPIVTRAMTPA
jgi:hypothetical protein